MSQVQELHDVTSELYELVQTLPSSDEREGVIEKVNELLDQREKLLLDGMEGP